MISLLLPRWLVGIMTLLVMLLVLLFWGGMIFIPFMLLKLILPFAPVQTFLSKVLVAIAQQWVASNQLVFRLMHAPQWKLDDQTQLDPRKSYLLICNHQSWADILILFDLFHGRTPFLRFFLKRELIWVPLIGVICWALDMPFMQRQFHKKKTIANVKALEQDLATTRRFCEKYREHPITVVNFVEGTRFTEAKRNAQKSELQHLLRPKSAGLSFTLNAMGDQFGGIIDVTLAYQPSKRVLAWSWLCGEQSNMSIQIDTLPIPSEILTGNHDADSVFRARFQHWLYGIWARKDARLERMLNDSGHAQPRTSAT